MPSLPSLLLQCLLILAIAVLVYEARRLVARGASMMRAALGRGSLASDFGRLQPHRIGSPPAPASMPDLAASPQAPPAPLAGNSATSAWPRPPALAAGRRLGGQAGWLALLAAVAVIAIVAVMLVRFNRDAATRASNEG